MDCQHDHRHSLFCILPPHMLEAIAESGDAKARKWALGSLSAGAGQVTLAGSKAHDAPCGNPEQASLTGPAKPPGEVRLTG